MRRPRSSMVIDKPLGAALQPVVDDTAADQQVACLSSRRRRGQAEQLELFEEHRQLAGVPSGVPNRSKPRSSGGRVGDGARDGLLDDGIGCSIRRQLQRSALSSVRFNPVAAGGEGQRQAWCAPSRQRRLLFDHLLQLALGLVAQPGFGAVLDLARCGLRRQGQVERVAFALRFLPCRVPSTRRRLPPRKAQRCAGSCQRLAGSGAPCCRA
jgi:hypothetical protein